MSERIEALRAALAADGFVFSTRSPAGIEFAGVVTASGRTIGLRLVYPDLLFAGLPQVFVDTPQALGVEVFPHLDEHNELCVVDRDRYVADRYNVAGIARGLIERARENLIRGLSEKGRAEIAAELPQHWGGGIVNCEFEHGFQGQAEYTVDANGRSIVRRAVSNPSRAPRPINAARTIPAFLVGASGEISLNADQGRPTSFGQFVEWAGAWDAGLAQAIRAAAGQSAGEDHVCLVSAPNGIVGGIVEVSSLAPAVVKAMSRPEAWTGFVARGAIDDAKFIRLRGRYMSLDYALNRNYGAGAAPLTGRKIALIGCGAIGGYLARNLAQMGAGRDEGRLSLLDSDTLETTNLGRHWLGLQEVGLNKAEACKRRIDTELPGAAVSAWPLNLAERLDRLQEFDLVIDATGEHDVSELLNESCRRWQLSSGPTLLHIWIEGRGAAVQSFISSEPAFACYRCLQPDLNLPSRVTPLRPEAPREIDGACGESGFTPYGPAAPTMAAALASAHVTDWAIGRARPLLRTLVIDPAVTRQVKDKDVDVSNECPRCASQ